MSATKVGSKLNQLHEHQQHSQGEQYHPQGAEAVATPKSTTATPIDMHNTHRHAHYSAEPSPCQRYEIKFFTLI